jgi:RNA polymerase subunit RPABC4/transcription elongation factor Spt4
MAEVLVSDSLINSLKLAGIISIAYILVLWLSAVVWTYRDVKKRTSDPLSQSVATLLVGLFNLPGLIVYLVIRPHETIAESYERSLEAEAMLHELEIDAGACPNCRRPIESDFNVCPQGRILLREPCVNCNKLVRTNWAACAYCGMERAPARTAPLPREAATTAPLRPPTRQTASAAQPAPAAASQPRSDR